MPAADVIRNICKAAAETGTGNFCERGGRFGAHSSNESMAPVFYKKMAFIAFFNAGVRALDIRDPLNIKEIGYYIPGNGSTWAAYWSPTDPNGEIVYTADAYRGVDVLRIDNGGLNGKKVLFIFLRGANDALNTRICGLITTRRTR